MRHLWGTTLSTAHKHRERGPGRIRGSSAQQRPHEGYPTHLPKVACNSMLEQSTNPQKAQNSNNLISKPEISSGELHATFVGNHVVDGTQTQRTRSGPKAARERGRGREAGHAWRGRRHQDPETGRTKRGRRIRRPRHARKSLRRARNARKRPSGRCDAGGAHPR